MERIIIQKVSLLPMDKQPFEIVERKGTGHPDTICDEIAEAVAQQLNKKYISIFGSPQHFNIDKTLLIAGKSIPKFGGGKILKNPKIFIGDRATALPNHGERIVAKIVAENWYLTKFGCPLDVSVQLRPTSFQLQSLFLQHLSNDTSACVGYAPLSKLEKMILDVEKFLQKDTHPEIGKDIKIMGIRKGNEISLTIAIAFIDQYFQDLEEYANTVQSIENSLICETGIQDIRINPDGLYITVSGTSAECGDSGQVGRGNGYNQVIPLCRPMSSEAYHGKNPITHIGKIYNKLSFDLAEDIHKLGAEEAYVWLKNNIGSQLNSPEVFVNYIGKTNIEKEIRKMVEAKVMVLA